MEHPAVGHPLEEGNDRIRSALINWRAIEDHGINQI